MLQRIRPASRAGLTGVAIVALLVAACGGNATPAPSAAASAAASPAASTVAVPPQAGDVASALGSLASYKFKVAWTSDGVTGGSFAALGADVSIEGTAVVKPTKASDVTMNLGAMKLRVVQVGDQSWVDFGTGLVASDDSSQSSMADSFAPDQLASSFLGSSMSGMNAVGDETKNGVAASHLQADATALAAASTSLASAFGVDGTWSIDAWLAKEGGYLVSLVMAANGTSDGQPASFRMAIDISDVNSPSNVVSGP